LEDFRELDADVLASWVKPPSVSYAKDFPFHRNSGEVAPQNSDTTRLATTPKMKEKILRLVDELVQLPQVNCPVKHHFAEGVYGREIFIPANTALVGMVHRMDNLVVLSQGTIRVVTEDGTIDISAPHTMLCKAGTQNAAVALTDVVWTNFFATTETDPDKLVEIIAEATADEIMGGSKNIQMLANQRAAQGELSCP
jgi:hypothetical protein